MKQIDAKQRGFSLIVAVSVVTLLIMTGTVVLDAVHSDNILAGADFSAQVAGYVAEAGAVWGKDTLEALLYPSGSAPNSPPVVSNLTAMTALSTGDALCPDDTVCTNWRLLTPSAWVSYGANGGTYRVAATCRPDCTGTPTSFVVRAVGKMTDGVQRLVEVDVGP